MSFRLRSAFALAMLLCVASFTHATILSPYQSVRVKLRSGEVHSGIWVNPKAAEKPLFLGDSSGAVIVTSDSQAISAVPLTFPMDAEVFLKEGARREVRLAMLTNEGILILSPGKKDSGLVLGIRDSGAAFLLFSQVDSLRPAGSTDSVQWSQLREHLNAKNLPMTVTDPSQYGWASPPEGDPYHTKGAYKNLVGSTSLANRGVGFDGTTNSARSKRLSGRGKVLVTTGTIMMTVGGLAILGMTSNDPCKDENAEFGECMGHFLGLMVIVPIAVVLVATGGILTVVGATSH